MRTRGEIEEKINLLVENDDNFTEYNSHIDWKGNESLEKQYSSEEGRKVLQEFAKWLLNQ